MNPTVGFALGLLISCLCTFHMRWVASTYADSTGIWALYNFFFFFKHHTAQADSTMLFFFSYDFVVCYFNIMHYNSET